MKTTTTTNWSFAAFDYCLPELLSFETLKLISAAWRADIAFRDATYVAESTPGELSDREFRRTWGRVDRLERQAVRANKKAIAAAEKEFDFDEAWEELRALRARYRDA